MTKQPFAAIYPVIAVFSVNCGGSGTGHGSSSGNHESTGMGGTSNQGNYPGAELGLPPVADGATRYETQPAMVPAGGDVMMIEWIAAPIESDMDVVSVAGLQSKGGHHAILYGTTNVQAVGTSRAWQNQDQFSAATLGAIGGDGNDAFQLPEGVVLRAKKGSALAIQSHYLNATAQPIEGRTVLDVKLGPIDLTKQVASTLATTTLKLSVPAGTTASADVTCNLQKDFRVLMYANHMHDWGITALTELVHADGTKTPLKVDPNWDPSWAFHPNYTSFTLQSSQTFSAGSSIHTTCTWTNTTTQTLTFPDEMCAFTAKILAAEDADCIDGQWQ